MTDAVERPDPEHARVPGSFRAPGGPTVALLASAVVLWVLAHSTRRETLGMAALIGLAAIFYLVRQAAVRNVPGD